MSVRLSSTLSNKKYLQGQLASLDQISQIPSLRWGISCIRFWGRSGQNFGFHDNQKVLWTYNGENVLRTIATSFFIKSVSNLQVMRTGIKSGTSSVLAHFPLLARELSALEGPIDFGKCLDNSHFIFDQIFMRLAGNEDSHEISDKFEFGLDWTFCRELLAL